jgi:transposase
MRKFNLKSAKGKPMTKSTRQAATVEVLTRAVRVGVDLAKQVIQVHAVDGAGQRLVSRAIKRDQFLAWCTQLPAGCLVAMEACGGSHHWARQLRAMGLDARMMAPNFVLPYAWKANQARTTSMMPRRFVRQPADRPCASYRSKPLCSKA